MNSDRRKAKNHRLRQLIMVGNLMEVEMNSLAERDEKEPLSDEDRKRLVVLQEAWVGSLTEFRKHLHAVPIAVGSFQRKLGGAA